MYLLCNRVMHYAWGSPTAIPEFLGAAPDGTPQAELWIGAHPGAPSEIDVGGRPCGLDELIAADPQTTLGPTLADRLDSLPYLMKYLAAVEPLSIQVHPSARQAEAGFAREQAAGIPSDSLERIYRDRRAKPELLCPITRFEVLCGFRDTARTAAFLAGLDVPGLGDVVDVLTAERPPVALRAALEAFLSLGAPQRETLVGAVAVACASKGPDFMAERRCLARLAEAYPGDLGVLIASLLNLLVLPEGHAIFLPAGTLHSYLGGTGIEIMGSSDNVIRAGLTPKHVDPTELLGVVDFEPSCGLQLDPVCLADGEDVYLTPASEFRLSFLDVAAEGHVELDQWGPDMILCLWGTVVLKGADGSTLSLTAGQSAFVEAATGGFEVSGRSRIARATVKP